MATYTLDDAMNQANAARTDAATLAANTQAALNKRAQAIVHNADGSTSNVNIEAGADPSKASSSSSIFITVAS